jgi:predicted membrane protein
MADFDTKDYGDRLRRDIHAEVHDRIQRKLERHHHRHSGRFGALLGAVIAGLGVLLLLQNLGLIHGDIWRFVWPVILIAVGLGMLIRAVDRHNLTASGPSSASSATVSAGSAYSNATDGTRLSPWAVFGGARRRVDSQDFDGGEAVAIFGGVQLDLRSAAIKKDEAVIDANALFGGIEIRVPENWNVSLRGSAIFGGYEDRTLTASSTQDARRPLLIITGFAVFGGVTVKN